MPSSSHVPPIVPAVQPRVPDFSVDEFSQWYDENAGDAFLDALDQANEAPPLQSQQFAEFQGSWGQ
ncbi:hypothetical protein LINPERHAP1_LOCUS8731 [Linum perenne]